MTITTTEARIYVGTYAKYNSGSIEGKWLDLSDYADIEDFYTAAKELHSDENDPELMFQDWEGIPYGMVSECHVNELVWELLVDGIDADMVKAFCECFSVDDLPFMHQWHVGTGETFSDWCADDAASNFPELDDPNNRLAGFFDWAKYERECDIQYSHAEVNGATYIFDSAR